MTRGMSLSLSQQLELSREVARLVRAQLPIEEALSQLAREDSSSRGRAAGEVGQQLSAGQSLAEALASGKTRPARMLSAAIDIGEASGRLDKALESWTSLYTNVHRMRQRLLVASVYPMLLMLMAILSLTVTAWFLIPHYENAFLILARKPPIWLGALVWVNRHLWVVVTTLIIVFCLPLFIWWTRRRGIDSFGAYRDGASRSYVHAHVAQLALIALHSGQAVTGLLPALERSAGRMLPSDEKQDLQGKPAGIERVNEKLLGSETLAILASLHAGVLTPEKSISLLESIAIQTKRQADERAARQTRRLPILVSLVVGSATVFTYVALIYGPWIVLFYEIIELSKL
jgi:hypothetical protein